MRQVFVCATVRPYKSLHAYKHEAESFPFKPAENSRFFFSALLPNIKIQHFSYQLNRTPVQSWEEDNRHSFQKHCHHWDRFIAVINCSNAVRVLSLITLHSATHFSLIQKTLKSWCLFVLFLLHPSRVHSRR